MAYPRILLLEDVDFDREMIQATLSKSGLSSEVFCVETREAFLAALRQIPVDLVLADYSLPGFNGLAALEMSRALCPEVPFILVSGVLGEELAIESLKQGATDYVLKQRLDRLVLSVQRALRERQERSARLQAERALQASEDRFRASVEIMLDCFGIYSAVRDKAGHIVDFRVEYVNLAAIRQFFPSREVKVGQCLCEQFPFHKRTELFTAYREVVETGIPLLRECLLYQEDGRPEALAMALDVRAAQLGDGVVVTWRDITARKRAEQEREELLKREQAAREEAETANRVKEEFLATLSHELRTPLNAMQGWIQLLQRRNLNDRMTGQAFDTISRNMEALKRLIEDVLDVSQIVRGRMLLDVAPLEMATVVRSAIEIVFPAVQAKNIVLVANFAADVSLIMGDRSRLQQVVWNLLSNAVKFTPEGGRIDVLLNMVDDHVCIQVQDTGKGIDPTFLPHIFERFRQADGSTTRRHAGLGLGLAIVRHLVEMHGGTIQVESPGLGQGSTFSVMLPALRTELEPHPMDLPASSTIAAETSDLPELDDVRVLLIENEQDSREFYTSALSAMGAVVSAVSSTEEAINLVPVFQPDVLVSDLGLPNEEGYALIHRVQALDGELKGAVRAIALTPPTPPENCLKVLESGYQIHLQKPVARRQLAMAVAHLVSSVN
ncbi:MAG TPA: ATP-binding protein [Leptolyngbyaceae cyanobacterium]